MQRMISDLLSLIVPGYDVARPSRHQLSLISLPVVFLNGPGSVRTGRWRPRAAQQTSFYKALRGSSGYCSTMWCRAGSATCATDTSARDSCQEA